MKTQAHRILQYIEENGSITALDAARDIGCLQLSARICEMEQNGYVFEKKREGAVNRYGDPVSYIRYSLVRKGA